ncbi:hypothetical protein PED38_02725 [Clavibacter sp. CT19]|uniref:hypothetical protein n=1 Tax=Clavibacter sp. CT19 TaxID=3018990 RepID=UPI0022EA859B|nr:hypothetical protein [Clavibacter sp. CT19]MDA3803704.1 hypothetical protein [Clavibacter sp. CT19]
MTENQTDALPARRRDVHIRTSAGTVMLFFVGVSVAGLRNSGSSQQPLRFEWIAEWGKALNPSSIAANSLFLATTLVLFGISVGGQATFESQRHKASIRRSVGWIGVLFASAALALCVFEIAAVIVAPETAPLLVVTIPTGIACWYFGVEIGRYIVPDFAVQLKDTQASLKSAKERKEDAPAAASTTAIAYATTCAYGVLMGWGTAAVAGQHGLPFWTAFGLSSAYSTMALILLMELSADTLVTEKRLGAFAIRVAAYLMYVMMFAIVDLSILATSGVGDAEGLLILFIKLAAPALFLRLPAETPQWIIDVSLSGALAGIYKRNVGQAVTRLEARVSRLKARDAETATVAQAQAQFLAQVNHCVRCARSPRRVGGAPGNDVIARLLSRLRR